MKKVNFTLLLMLFAFLGLTISVNAQIQIGTETNSGSIPVDPVYGYTYSQSIYTASEINASGDITELSFQFSGNSTIPNSKDWVIYIGYTSKTEFTSTSDWVNAALLTEVFNDTITVVGSGSDEWINIDITDFTYNGTSNLIIAVDENSSGYDAYDAFYNSSVSSNRSIYYTNDNTNPDPLSPPLSANEVVSAVPNIILGGITVSCPAPTALAATGITGISADLGWTENGTATTWNIEYGATGFTQGTGTLVAGITTNPHNITGLSPLTSYDYYVRANCGGGDVSSWVGPFNFTTLCAIVSASFTENFDAVSTPPDLPSCWSEIGDVITRTFTYYSSPNCLELQNAEFLISPELSDLTTGANQVRFFARGWSDDVVLSVGTITDPTDESTFTEVESIALSASYEEYTVPFYSTTDTYFAFKYASGFTVLLIDDVVYEPHPTCPAPSSLTASNITGTSADLSWTDNAGASLWDIELGINGFTPTSTPTQIGVTFNPYTYTSLSSGTSYDFYVRADCGGGDKSSWTGPFNFITVITCPAPSSLTATNITGTSADLSWTDNASASLWDIELGTADFSPTETPTQTWVVNSDTYSGLSPLTSYDYYVRANCGGDDYSTWVGPFNFTTLMASLTNPTTCGVGIAIPDNNCIDIPINVTGVSGTQLGTDILLREVKFIATHTWDTDLNVTLESPNGVTVELTTGNGGSDNDYGVEDGTCTQYTSFNMNAANSITSGSAPFVGDFIPEGDFVDFNDNSDPNGIWILHICDNASDDIGVFQFSELVFGVVNTETDILTYSFNEQTGPADIDATNHTINIEVNWEADLTALVAGFTLSTGATAEVSTVSQTSGATVNDFSSAVDYTITAEDGITTQNWEVTVTQEAAPQGMLCSNPLPLTLPVVNETGITAGFGDDYDEAMACGSDYMTGDDIVYQFTLTEDGFISGDLTTTNSYPGMFILDGCPDDGANCVVTSTDLSSSISFTDEPISAGTYFLIISSWANPQSIDFDFNLSFIAQSTETDILTFSFPEETAPATIDNVAHTVTIEVNWGADLTALVADFTLSYGATATVLTVVQENGVTSNNFTTPVIYTAIAENGTTTQDWIVTVTEAAANDETDILTYSFDEQTGAAIIDNVAHTVTIEVNWGADLTALVADFTLSYGATTTVLTVAQESGVTVNDFSSIVTYIVIAEDGSTVQGWDVILTQEATPAGITCGTAFSYGNINDPEVINDVDAVERKLWYTVVLDQNYVDVQFSTCGSVYDTKLYVYDACGGNQLAYNDDDYSGFCSVDNNQSLIEVTSLAAGTYYVMIEPWSSTDISDPTTGLLVTGTVDVSLSDDATLTDLQYNNITVDGFASDVYTYMVELPTGTTVVPTVTYTLSDANAGAVVTDASNLPGNTTVLVTAEDGITTNSYEINFTVSPLVSDDATLVDLTVNGETVDGFDPVILSYNVELPFGTIDVPTVGYTLNDENASAEQTDATALPGITTVLVTAEDGITTNLYEINFTVSPLVSDDATLVDLTVNGETVEGFASDVYTYIVELPFGTTEVPSVGYVLSDANANAVQTDATALPGNTTVLVTAEDGIANNLYTIIFSISTVASDDATLVDLTVNGETVEGFASDIYTYNVELPYGTTVVPTVAYVLSDVNATAVQTDATALPGTTTVVVTAEDGTTELTYTINFTVAVGVNIVDANSNISVYPNPNDGLFNVNITIPVQNNIELQLLNVQGQLIDIYNAVNVTELNKEFDVTGLSSGVYFLKINTGNQIKVEKVIVK